MGGRFNPPFDPSQQMALALIPKCTSIPSGIASLLLIRHVLRSPKRRHRVYHRIVGVMSSHNAAFAAWTFLSTWTIPKGTPGIYGTAGTTNTCNAAGFIAQGAGLSSALLHATLVTYFVLTVRCGWRERQVRKLQTWLIGLPMVWGWGTACAGIPLQLYNSFGLNCWIAALPPGCDQVSDAILPCIRGEHASLYRWAFYTAEIWLVFGFSVVCLLIIYRHIRQHEEATRKHRVPARYFSSEACTASAAFCASPAPQHHITRSTLSSSALLVAATTAAAAAAATTATSTTTGGATVVVVSSRQQQKQPKRKLSQRQRQRRQRRQSATTPEESERAYRHSRLFAQQALFFTAAFGLTWIWSLAAWAIQERLNTVFLPILCFQTIFVPSMGFLDALVYVRPRWVRLQRQYPHLTTWQRIRYGLEKHVLGRSLEWSQIEIITNPANDNDQPTNAVLSSPASGKPPQVGSPPVLRPPLNLALSSSHDDDDDDDEDDDDDYFDDGEDVAGEFQLPEREESAIVFPVPNRKNNKTNHNNNNINNNNNTTVDKKQYADADDIEHAHTLPPAQQQQQQNDVEGEQEFDRTEWEEDDYLE